MYKMLYYFDMTNGMLKDYIKTIEKKFKRLVILTIILALVCVALIVFLFSNYEVVYEEYKEETEYTIEQENSNNGENTAIVDSSISNNNDLYTICGTVIICTIIFTGGLVIYGKSKNNN